jgi:hypothetical protein
LRLDFERLTEAGVLACKQAAQSAAASAAHRQVAAENIVRMLYEALCDAAGAPACVLIRCFQTCPYARLPLHYRDAADTLLDTTPSHPNMRCLTLLATRGMRSVWNDVMTSVHHQAIPLPSVEVVRRAPMIARLLEQFGVAIEQVVTFQDSIELAADRAAGFEMFHIAEAANSPFLPAQAEFVQPYGVRSVLGMGGVLPDGELFAVVMFARVTVSAEVAALCRPLALGLREALSPFPAALTFDLRD